MPTASNFRDPLPFLPRLPDWGVENWDEFTRIELAEMFGGIHPSIISRDCKALGFDEYSAIKRCDVWRIYVLKCWQRKKRGAWRQSFIDEIKKKGDEAVIKEYVLSQGGSKKNCEEMIDRFITKKRTKKENTWKTAAVSQQ